MWVRVSLSVCAQSYSLLLSQPEWADRPASLGPSQVIPGISGIPHSVCPAGGGRAAMLSYLRFSRRGELETGATQLQKESRLAEVDE